MYRQSFNLLYNIEKVSIQIINSDYKICISSVDQLCTDAVGFPHSHKSDFEIYYVQKGLLNIIIDCKMYTAKAGDFIIVSPGVIHYTLYNPIQENQYFVIVFSIQKKTDAHIGIKNLNDMLSNIMVHIITDKVCIGKDEHGSQKYINAMLEESDKRDFGWQSMLNYFYSDFILSILRNIVPTVKEEKNPDNENIAMRIMRFMSDNYSKDITIQDVADMLHCSPRHINRIFSNYFNSSFAKTLSVYRVNYSKDYLLNTDYSIEKIAELVGFSSPNMLFRLFKEQESMTPTQYRKRYRSHDNAE